MVAHFELKHNRALSKHSIFAQLFLFVCCFFTQFCAQAQDPVLIIDDSVESRLLSSEFVVYKQESRILSFLEFQKTKGLLPYYKVTSSNYGFVPNGTWLYTKIENQSALRNWFISIRFSQLQDVQLYVTSENQIIYQNTDGIRNKTSFYPMPTFALELPQNQALEMYIYVKSSSLSLVAPIYIQTDLAHKKLSMLDFSVWGLFYGMLFVLFLYAIIFVLNKNKKVGMIYISNLLFVFLFQVLWSGHSALLPIWIETLNVLISPESMVLLLSITSTLLNLMLIPLNKQSRVLRLCLLYLMYTFFAMLVLFFVPVLSSQTKLIIIHILAFSGLFLNLIICITAYFKGFSPAIALFVGWVSSTVGASLSVFFIYGILPTNLFHQHIFHFTLIAQSCLFLLAMVLRNQYDLELDIQEAENDALNNFLLVEEQNVHLDIARKEAIKASEVKSQFLANMSHEIRTPLNAIMGFSRELETNQNMLEREEHVRIINSAATDLLTIVNDILDFSKMEAGKLTVNMRPFSPRDILEDVVALMAKNAHLKQLEFIYDVDVLPDFLLGDALKIKQLLSNLLSNALKFTNYGHITLRARVTEQKNDNCQIEFEVKDTGIGISQNDINKLFDAFHQLDDELNRSFQGTGLGLVICQTLTTLMGGKISVLSEPSKGSAFIACIPFKMTHGAAKLNSQQKFHSQRAYLIDDWEVSCRTALQQLATLGFSVISLATIEELSNYNITHEFVFVTLPFRNIDQRNAILETLGSYDISNIVFIYSGPEPSKASFSHLQQQPKLIRLPLTTRKLEDIDSHPAKFNLQDAHSDVKMLPAIRILAVDDMELNLRLLATWLNPSAVTLDLAYDGQSAIEKCEAVDYDIILMDIQMPHMDGLEATQHIRKTELNIGTPILAVTAHALDSEKQHFLDSGMDDILSKPIKLENLVALINTWCDENHNESIDQTKRELNSIDWEMALKLSYQDKEAALSYLDAFVERLPTHVNEIESGWKQQRTDILLASIHKLHGACCYTGVPRLQEYCYQAETILKSELLEKNPQTISAVLLEIDQLIEQWPKQRETLR